MKKKLFYAILICIIVAGIVVIATIGLKADIIYSKNVRIDINLGKEYNNSDIEQIAKEVFGTNRVLVQKIGYYEDSASITISQDVEDISGKIEQLNNKINEKYQLENKKENIQVTYQPNIKLSSVIKPYIIPLTISMVIILVYVMIRFRKIGVLKTLLLYALTVLASEAIYLSVLAIARIPINRLIPPIGLAIYTIVLTVITAKQEKKLATYSETQGKKRK